MSILYEGSNGPITRLNSVPVPTEQHSQINDLQGGINPHDVRLLEKLAHFSRERIPECVVYTKDTGAFGELTVTEDVSKYTKATVLQSNTITPMPARFPTTASEQGSPDSWYDVRGLLLKFYTEESSLDIADNNAPMFLIRDGIKFPDFIHSQKRLPDMDLRDANMQWDLWIVSPESAYQVTYLMGDHGIPEDLCHMGGSGSHTYQWTSAEGERFWAKYHSETRQGWDFLTDDEAAGLVGENTDHARRDLLEAIERGDYPTWGVKVQITLYDETASYKVNPFDPTKTWSQKDYPLIPVGYFALNRNPGNFFAGIKQATSVSSNTVPGAGFSPDKMLLARVFSYADTRRYRLGVNHDQLLVNQPRYPVDSFSRDGYSTYYYADPNLPIHDSNATGYGPEADIAAAAKATGCPAHFSHTGQVDTGTFGQWESVGEEFYAGAYTQHPEDDGFSQAGDPAHNVMGDTECDHLTGNIVGIMQGVSPGVEQRVYQHWINVDS